MPISMYQASIPAFVRGFGNLAAILRMGEARDVTLVGARLAPDMLTLAGQIQRASDTAKGCAARLSGLDNPAFADEEKSFADLQARIAKTVDFLNGIPAVRIDGSEDKDVEIKTGGGTLSFAGRDYLLTFALPNFYFHVVTAYDILRHNGVAVGKMDYLGSY